VYSRSIKILYTIFSSVVSPSEVHYSVANITQMSYTLYTDFMSVLTFQSQLVQKTSRRK